MEQGHTGYCLIRHLLLNLFFFLKNTDHILKHIIGLFALENTIYIHLSRQNLNIKILKLVDH